METRVSMHVLSLAKGLPVGGATCTYQVPEELLELTRTKKREHAQQTPTMPHRASEGAPTAASPIPGANEALALSFPECTHSARVTLTEELCVTPPCSAATSPRRPLPPWPLVCAIAAVMAYSIVRLLLK